MKEGLLGLVVKLANVGLPVLLLVQGRRQALNDVLSWPCLAMPADMIAQEPSSSIDLSQTILRNPANPFVTESKTLTAFMLVLLICTA